MLRMMRCSMASFCTTILSIEKGCWGGNAPYYLQGDTPVWRTVSQGRDQSSSPMMLHPQIQAAWLVLLILIHTEGPALEPANAIGYESLMDPDEGLHAIGHSNRPEEELLHKKHDVRE